MSQLSGNLTARMTFAVYGTAKEFQGHAGRVYSFLKSLGCKVYAVSRDGAEMSGDRCYPSLASLPIAVDVVIVATGRKLAAEVVAEAVKEGVARVWFQNFNASKEALEISRRYNLDVTRGCALRHMAFRGWRRLFSPCYWHGLRALKPQPSGATPRYFLLPALAIIAFTTVYPVFMVIYGSFKGGPPGEPAPFSLDGYVRAWTDWWTIKTFLLTFALAVPRVLFGLILAILLAWIVTRTNTPLRGLMRHVIWFAYFLPVLPITMSWMVLAGGKRGWLNQVLMSAFDLSSPPLDIRSYWGIIFISSIYVASLIFLLIAPAFQNMEASSEESSWVLGASKLTTLRRITVPLLTPAILGATLLAFLFVLASFEMELLLGSIKGIYVLTTFIWVHINAVPTDYPAAMAMSTVFMLVTWAIVLLQLRVWRGRTFVTVTGKGTTRPVDLGRWKWASFGFVMTYFAIGILLPLTILIIGSFQTFWGSFDFPWTLGRWKNIPTSPAVLRSLKNTLILSTTVATVGTVVYFLMSYAAVRSRLRGRQAIELLSWLPAAAPGIVLTIGMLWTLYVGIPGVVKLLYGTLALMSIAVLIESIPIGVRVMNGGMAQISSELEESSRVSGASWFRTIRDVVIPLLAPTLLSAWVLSFLWAARAVLIIMFLYVPSSTVLSLLMFGSGGVSASGSAAVLGVILAGVMSIVAILAQVAVSRMRRGTGDVGLLG
ncbi:MAG: ABC transporter permease subunit [Chloroflexi bacterium]|nr:ABC transporter permease subunit [Chloroflexota bacterium]